jgi:hypothetical protein
MLAVLLSNTFQRFLSFIAWCFEVIGKESLGKPQMNRKSLSLAKPRLFSFSANARRSFEPMACQLPLSMLFCANFSDA